MFIVGLPANTAMSATLSRQAQEEELAGLRVMALRTRALQSGVAAAHVDAAMDAVDGGGPKGALMQLLLAEPKPVASEADRLVGLLAGGADDRERAYGALSAGSGSDIAAACASPLCAVMAQDAAEVDTEEYKKVAQILCGVAGADPIRVAGECHKPGQPNTWSVWAAETSVLGEVLAKEPAQLRMEDALVVVCAYAPLHTMNNVSVITILAACETASCFSH